MVVNFLPGFLYPLVDKKWCATFPNEMCFNRDVGSMVPSGKILENLLCLDCLKSSETQIQQ